LQTNWWLAEVPVDSAAPDASVDPTRDAARAWVAGPAEDWVDVGARLPATAQAAWAVCRVYVPQPETVVALSEASPMRIYVNGHLLHASARPSPGNGVPLTLHAGWNTLVCCLELTSARAPRTLSMKLVREAHDPLAALLAGERHDEVAAALEAAVARDPESPPLLRRAARWHRRRYEVLQAQGQLAAAEVHAAAAQSQYEKLRLLMPQHTSDAAEFAELLFLRAQGWTPLVPIAMGSSGGATLERERDGSIFVSGFNAPQDRYTLTARPGLPRVTALLLQTIPDPRLPAHGAGRYPENGNFLLSEIRLSRLAGDATEDVKLGTAWADYSEPSQPVTRALDGNPDSAWDSWPQQRKPRVAVFAPETPLQVAAMDRLTVQLDFHDRNYGRHGLGRFRVSV
jgi:hypothetical protein